MMALEDEEDTIIQCSISDGENYRISAAEGEHWGTSKVVEEKSRASVYFFSSHPILFPTSKQPHTVSHTAV